MEPSRNGDTVLRAVSDFIDDLDFFRPWNGVRLVRPVTGEFVDGGVTGLSFLSTPTAFEGGPFCRFCPVLIHADAKPETARIAVTESKRQQGDRSSMRTAPRLQRSTSKP
jgi:hypothetical protein